MDEMIVIDDDSDVEEVSGNEDNYEDGEIVTNVGGIILGTSFNKDLDLGVLTCSGDNEDNSNSNINEGIDLNNVKIECAGDGKHIEQSSKLDSNSPSCKGNNRENDVLKQTKRNFNFSLNKNLISSPDDSNDNSCPSIVPELQPTVDSLNSKEFSIETSNDHISNQIDEEIEVNQLSNDESEAEIAMRVKKSIIEVPTKPGFKLRTMRPEVFLLPYELARKIDEEFTRSKEKKGPKIIASKKL